MEKNKPGLTENTEEDRAFLENALEKVKPTDVTQGLSRYIEKRWNRISKDFKPVRRDMISAMRRVRGEYSPTKLQQIQTFKGSEIYVRSLEAKARALVSWIKDIHRGDQDLPWILEPTAIPTLPDETLEEIKSKVKQKAIAMEQQLIQSGVIVDRTQIADLMQKYHDEQMDQERKALDKEAKKRVDRAAKEIRDQTQESGWGSVFNDFLYWFVRVKFGIIRGPVLVKKDKQQWVYNEEINDYEFTTVSALVNDTYAPSPFNVYFERGMNNINNGDIIEIHEMTMKSLAGMIDVPGYSSNEVRAVLKKAQDGKLKEEWFTIEDKTQVNQVTKEVKNDSGREEASLKGKENKKILAMEFTGTVAGSLLNDWGYPEELDPQMQYQVNCWKIDGHVIKAELNSDKLGRSGYHITSYAKNPSWIVGEGLIEFGGPIEDAMNAILRALQNNTAFASGPMSEIDEDRVDTSIPMHPWREIKSTSLQMKNNGPAVTYYQPQMHAQELSTVYSFLSKLLDEMTVPAYAQGASQSGVTTGTATVFTQLLAAASRAIKAAVSNIDDDIITPYIQMCYDYNMENTEDPTSKGDARVVAKGITNLLAKEQAAQRKIEYLQAVANPTYQQMLGEKNIGSILLQLAKSNDIKLPDPGRLEGEQQLGPMLEQMLMSQAGVDPMQANGQIAAGGGAPTQGQGMNPDNSKAGVVNG